MKCTRTPWLALIALAAASCRSSGTSEPAPATPAKPAAQGVAATPAAPAAAKPAPVAAKATAPATATPTAPAEPTPPVAVSGTRAERLTAMKTAHNEAMEAFYAPFRAAKTDEEREKLMETTKPPDDAPFVAVARALVEEDPTDATAFDALAWMLAQRPEKADQERWIALVERHHFDNPKLGESLWMLQYAGPPGRSLLEKLSVRSTDRTVRGRALMALAEVRKDELSTAESFATMEEGEDKARYVEHLGQQEFDRIRGLDRASAEKDVIALYEKVLREYADVEGYRDDKLGDTAKNAMFEMQNLVVGKVAPEITGEDIDGVALTLSEHRGKVVLLDFWGHW
jgi:hypothetical protein